MRKILSLMFLAGLFLTIGAMTSAQTAFAEKTGMLKFGDEKFPVSIGEIKPDDEGNMTVELLTELNIAVPDFDPHSIMSIPLEEIMGEIHENIKLKIAVGDQNIHSGTFNMQGGLTDVEGQTAFSVSSIIFSFPTKEAPDKITIYNAVGTAPVYHVSFDGKTKEVIE